MIEASEPNRQELLQLLQQEPRGSANRHGDRIKVLIDALEQAQPVDLSRPEALEQLEAQTRCCSDGRQYRIRDEATNQVTCLVDSSSCRALVSGGS